MDSNEFTIIAILVALLSPIASFFILNFHRKKTKAHYDWEKKCKALSYSISRSERIKQARLKLSEKFQIGERENEIEYSDIDDASKHIPEIKPHIIDLLGHWENMCLAIKQKIVDEDVAFEMVGSTVIRYTFVFQQFIEMRQKSNPRAYKYLIEVAKSWQNEKIPENERIIKNMKIRLEVKI